jgi:hypothetical protein
MKYYLLFLTLLPLNSFARCFSDIYSVGINVDSFAFSSQNNQGKVEVASDYAFGLKAGRIIFCPKNKIEFNPYFKLRVFQTKKSQQKTDLADIDTNNTLLSGGMDFRWEIKPRFELVGDGELREEYFLRNNNNRLVNDDYLNLKLAMGLRYSLIRNKDNDYNIIVKYGQLLALTKKDQVNNGDIYEIDLEYFKRMTKNYSIRADLYFARFEQRINELKTERIELGARFNYIFRY